MDPLKHEDYYGTDWDAEPDYDDDEEDGQIETSHGWLIKRTSDKCNEAVCPNCKATLDLDKPDSACPNGCNVKVCEDFLCPYCLYGDDPFCEGK